LENPVVDWRIILKLISKKWDRKVWTGLIWLRIGTGRVLVNALMDLLVPQNAGNFLNS
jgi:hypothetical protein